jgi:hypothetical protein
VSGANLDALERAMHVLAAQSPVPFVYDDPANGERLVVSSALLASRRGYLPAIVNAGEALWREVTGKGFGLDIVRDAEALLGYRLRSVGAGSFALVMLSSMEAMRQVATPDAILVSELGAVWAASVERLRRDPHQLAPEWQGPRP